MSQKGRPVSEPGPGRGRCKAEYQEGVDQRRHDIARITCDGPPMKIRAQLARPARQGGAPAAAPSLRRLARGAAAVRLAGQLAGSLQVERDVIIAMNEAAAGTIRTKASTNRQGFGAVGNAPARLQEAHQAADASVSVV